MNMADRIQYLRKTKGFLKKNLRIKSGCQDKQFQNGKVDKAHPI